MVAYNREWLKNYFTYDWPSSRTAGLDGYYWTGWRLIDEIQEGETVLDVGCGVNPFKRHIKGLHGIDITDIGSDEQVAIEDFKPETKFDVAFCLGSINFGSLDEIVEQVSNLTRDCLKDTSRIYWRCNPGHRDHGNKNVDEVPFFNWNINHHIMLSQLNGFQVTEFMPDKNRMYVKWERNSLSISPKTGE